MLKLHLKNDFDGLFKALERSGFIDTSDFSKEDCLLIGTKYLEKNEYSLAELFLLGYIQSKRTNADEILGLINSLANNLPIETRRRLIDAAIKRYPFKKSIIEKVISSQADSKDPVGILEILRKKTYSGKLDKTDYPILVEALQSLDIRLDYFFNSEESNHNFRLLMAYNAFSKLHSLGNDCRLGFLQRDHDFEPLGLFRWASIPLENMIKLIETDFKDFFNYENLSLKYHKHLNTGFEEYQVHDRIWQFTSHTFMYGDDQEKILKKAYSHYKWLARAFTEGLEDLCQTFVYKADFGFATSEYFHLHNALNRHTKNKLIVVEKDPQKDFIEYSTLKDGILLINLPMVDSHLIWERVVYENYEFIMSK